MNIPRPDPVPSRGVSDLDRHIETLLRVIHSRNLAWSDLSEVGKQVERPLTDVEQLLTNVGDDAHEITLATETIITALKLQRDALAIQSSRRRARFGSMLLLMCRCRTYSPQKCRMKIPQFEVSANPLRG